MCSVFFTAYSAPVKQIQTLASEWGLLYGLGQDQKLFNLVEKDIQSKLDLLFKKNFYDIAIKIAKVNEHTIFIFVYSIAQIQI